MRAGGSFPSESIQTANSESSIFYNKLWFKDQPSKILNIPFIEIQNQDVSKEMINKIDYLLLIENRIFILDSIQDNEDKKLNFFFTDKKEYLNFKKNVNHFYTNPSDESPIKNNIRYSQEDLSKGVTELYWAAKGTSVAHHWAYFYEGAILSGTRKAQYGNLLPFIAKTFSDQFFQSSIVQFIKIAFGLFFVVAILYVIIFNQIFKIFEPKFLIAPILLTKVYIFSKIGLFAQFLAPGYHWYRELITIAIFYFLVQVKEFNRKTIAILFATIILSFLMDPSFLIISVAAFILTSLFSRKLNFKYILILLCTGLIFLFALKNNIIYLIDSLKIVYEIIGLNQEILNDATKILCLAVLGIFLNLASGFNKNYIYFNFISLISFLYIIVTPDKFHYYKWLEYSLPMLAVLMYNIIFLIRSVRIRTNIDVQTENQFLLKTYRFVYNNFSTMISLLCLGLILFASINLYKLINTPPKYFHLRMFDNHQIFFNAEIFNINGREIGLNMSEDNIQQLSQFPKDLKYDYLISKNDKFILFLYDRKNNFGTVDLVPTLDEKQYIYLKEKILKSNANFMLDTSNFEIDGRFGILRDSKVLDAKNVSYLSYKNKIRLYYLSDLIRNHCESTHRLDGWETYHCGN
jgi:hypothetical protein